MSIAEAAGMRPYGSGPATLENRPHQPRVRRISGVAGAVCATILVTCALPAHSRQAMSGGPPPGVAPAPMNRSPDIGPSVGPHDEKCPPGRTYDARMNMCMVADAPSRTSLALQANQFAVYSDTSGPRGQSRISGPGLWMLMLDTTLSPRNRFSIQVMGSLEQLTVGDSGTPQLLQTENLDAMHAHDTLMGLEFRDVTDLEPDGRRQLTLLFSPRGAAASGPVPFMHRQSAEGNPDAPLGHDSQDGLHDVSTVLGLAYRTGATTLEATAFSGNDIRWPFPLHRPDSFALRVNRDLNDGLALGVSFADVQLAADTGGDGHDRFTAAWISTNHLIGEATLKTSLVWARHTPGPEAPLDSVLVEAVYSRGRNNIYGRAESLQITPRQLDITPASDDAKWVQAVTLGYERNLLKRDGVALYLGGSFTQNFGPQAFESDYGSDPRGAKLYARLAISGASLMGF